MDIELRIDIERVTLDDLIMVDELQAGNIHARQLKEFVSRFVYENGSYLPQEQAFQKVGKLTITQLRDSFDNISKTVKELQAAAVPPVIGAAS